MQQCKAMESIKYETGMHTHSYLITPSSSLHGTGDQCRVPHMLHKCSTTELYPQPFLSRIKINIFVRQTRSPRSCGDDARLVFSNILRTSDSASTQRACRCEQEHAPRQ